MLKIARIFTLSFLLVAILSCQENPDNSKPISPDELLRIWFNSIETNADKDFFIYLPLGYHDDPNKEWPVILFLHGDGERGNSKDELGFVLKHGPLYEAWVQKKELPFIIISPQLPLFGRDTMDIPYLKNRERIFPDRLLEGVPDRDAVSRSEVPMAGAAVPDITELYLPPGGWDLVEQDLITIIDKVMENFQADSQRLYLTGLSYGGFGTWYMASKYPDLFAAVSPVVGWGHPEQMAPIAEKELPIWVFSGGRDFVVHKQYFLPGVNKLEELGHTSLRYTIHEDMGHDTWKRVYSGDDLYHWFLEHRL